MPEGPEVRRYADMLHAVLAGKTVTALTARTKVAKAWLLNYPEAFVGKRVLRIQSRGKNLVGLLEGDLYFYSHLMMWGKWQIEENASSFAVDRRERARITVDSGAAAVLFSAPVFEVGESVDPFSTNDYLRALGPDILPYPEEKPFCASCFIERLCAPNQQERQIGAVLLDQNIAAGIGNYLRAEILFVCGISPFQRIMDLNAQQLADLSRVVPEVAEIAYVNHGVSVPPHVRERMQGDRSLIYPNSSPDWGARHWVFRRTNLPCLVCGTKIRQQRQVTRQTEAGEDKERIIYFCPTCQGKVE